MKNIDSYFSDFLSDIRLTSSQKTDLIAGHKTLRDRLMADPDLKPIIVNTFLQGSYRRATAVRPLNNKRADVDVIVVTNLDKSKVTPAQAIEKFVAFCEKHYNGKYTLQGRSIAIELSYVDLDIVVTSAPSEVDSEALNSKSITSNLTLEDFTKDYEWRLIKGWSEPDFTKSYNILSEALKKEAEWKLSPLWIPDRDAKVWGETHPLEQIRWTRDKNKNTDRHYVNVVKALKWWRILKLTDIKYPKGYPIEHMIGDCCPDAISSVAEGVCRTLETIVSSYRVDRLNKKTPSLSDRGVPAHNVWKRVSDEDFVKFYDHVADYAKIAREAYDAEKVKDKVKGWRKLFGEKFPDYNGDEEEGTKNSSGGFTPRKEVSSIAGGRFA
jgi:hypothetical protein